MKKRFIYNMYELFKYYRYYDRKTRILIIAAFAYVIACIIVMYRKFSHDDRFQFIELILIIFSITTIIVITVFFRNKKN